MYSTNDCRSYKHSEIQLFCPLYFQKVVATDPRKISIGNRMGPSKIKD